jgi:hypothetical protein
MGEQMIFFNILIAFCFGLMTWSLSGRFWAGFILSVAWMVMWWAIHFRDKKGVTRV